MLVTDQNKLRDDIHNWAEEYGYDRSAMIPILQRIQKKYHRISEYGMQVVADVLGVFPVEVYGVVSFYSFLEDKFRGRFIIRLCRTISCNMLDKDRVARQLENDLNISFGETTPDGVFSLEWANCLGMCDQGPAMLVNDQIFTDVTPKKVQEILEGCRNTFGVYATHREEGVTL